MYVLLIFIFLCSSIVLCMCERVEGDGGAREDFNHWESAGGGSSMARCVQAMGESTCQVLARIVRVSMFGNGTTWQVCLQSCRGG